MLLILKREAMLQFSFFSLVIMLTLCLLTTYVFLCHHSIVRCKADSATDSLCITLSHFAYCESLGLPMRFHDIPYDSILLIVTHTLYY